MSSRSRTTTTSARSRWTSAFVRTPALSSVVTSALVPGRHRDPGRRTSPDDSYAIIDRALDAGSTSSTRPTYTGAVSAKRLPGKRCDATGGVSGSSWLCGSAKRCRPTRACRAVLVEATARGDDRALADFIEAGQRELRADQ
jgi:hypothetical protein